MSRPRTARWLKALTRSSGPMSSARPRRRSRGLFVEPLELRITPSAYVVDIGGDASGSAAGTGSGTSGNLRYCLNQAIADHQADTINFASSLAGDTITLSSTLVTAPSGFANPYGQTSFIVGASDNITIDGSGAPGLTLSGGGATRLFAIEGGGTLKLENLTLSDGIAQGGAGGSAGVGGSGGGGAGLGGAVLVDGSTFTAAGCTFVNNLAIGGHGGNRSGGYFSGGGGGGLGGAGGGGGQSQGGAGGGLYGGAGGFAAYLRSGG
jgi:hypothetical protein